MNLLKLAERVKVILHTRNIRHIFIEPIYMQSEMTKQEFVKSLNDTFEKLVYPVVEKAIRNLSMTDKLNMMNGSESVMKPIEQIDFEARKIAYCYLNLLLIA